MTPDQEILFAQFLDYLNSEQSPPEYLDIPPKVASKFISVFDSYQIVSEWTALRHEIKQQGKVLRSAQDALQTALSATISEKSQMQITLEESQKQILAQSEQQQEKLLRDLLGIMDALERACNYWQEEIEALSTNSIPKSVPSRSFWRKLGDLFSSKDVEIPPTETSSLSASMSEILISNQEGVELIKRSLLDLLRSRKVVPIEALGKPFDPQKMYAVGREKSADVSENLVIQEVVQGYLWGNRILREAQVIVASPYTQADELSADTQ
jgi:molecular chaperone GrpE